MTSERGLEFLDNGLNTLHHFGFKKCYSNDGKRDFDIFYQYWISDPSLPSILFFHGNAENSCTHPKFFYHLVLKGYNVFAFDNIGHGNSSGLRGSVKFYSDYIDIVNEIFSFFNKELSLNWEKSKTLKRKKDENFIPLWLIFGFSFGGLIATDFALQKNGMIKNVFLLSPWFMTHKRLINNLTKTYLTLFRKFFNPDNLMNLKLQNEIFSMDKESYINLNKNLTDNEKFLTIRKKDTRIFRVLSKKRLAEIYSVQKKILKIDNKSNINFFTFLPEKDLIVDSEFTIKLMKKYNGFFEILKDSYHDFLDYEDIRWDNFTILLNNYLTKIVK